MYKQKRKQKNSGITLIALVLTIIVLLILAGVVLSLALEQNGLVFKARETKQEQEIAQEKDRIMTAYGATFVHKNGKYDESRFKENLKKSGVFGDDDTLKTISDSPFKIELVRKHEGYTVTYTLEEGTIKHEKLADNTTTNNTIPADLQVGDTIIYDPTKGVLDQSKLTYTSQITTGYLSQIINAKSTNNEWIVISIANNQIKVMSKELIETVNPALDKRFILEGGIGWLYAEEELHKACSIYGHGKGTQKITTTYQIGNYQVPGEAKTKTLIGSGARSMTMVDIVQIMKGNSYIDFTADEKKLFNSHYMDPYKKSIEVNYPTISSDNEKGSSTNTQSFDNEHYNIDKNRYDNYLVTDIETKKNKEKLKEHIFKNNGYWVASCYVNVSSSIAYFCVRSLNLNVEYSPLYGDSAQQSVFSPDDFLRPVVYLDGSMLEKQSEGIWKIKD